MNTPHRSADVARSRLGISGAPIITGPSNPIIRRQRYESRREQWESRGKRSPLELWRAP